MDKRVGAFAIKCLDFCSQLDSVFRSLPGVGDEAPGQTQMGPGTRTLRSRDGKKDIGLRPGLHTCPGLVPVLPQALL